MSTADLKANRRYRRISRSIAGTMTMAMSIVHRITGVGALSSARCCSPGGWSRRRPGPAYFHFVNAHLRLVDRADRPVPGQLGVDPPHARRPAPFRHGISATAWPSRPATGWRSPSSSGRSVADDPCLDHRDPAAVMIDAHTCSATVLYLGSAREPARSHFWRQRLTGGGQCAAGRLAFVLVIISVAGTALCGGGRPSSARRWSRSILLLLVALGRRPHAARHAGGHRGLCPRRGR